LKTYYSNGKLLLTAEYLVLDGAIALAFPTKFGQSLTIQNSNSEKISWKSFDVDGSLWYEDSFSIKDIKLKNNRFQNQITNTLIEILHQAHLQNPNFLIPETGFCIETTLTFSKNWGLGTSSTLINNIAQWFGVDGFELLQQSFGGSGYDIACAQHNSPILFQLLERKPKITEVVFKPHFSEHLYFVYLNQKQNSRAAIENYKSKKQNLNKFIGEINQLTNEILESINFSNFCELMVQHENILSQILEQTTIQEKLFADFDGAIKSLGAWGGDFVLVASSKNPSNYFSTKGFNTIFKFDDMILSI
jgi:mevalonate kinase